MLGLQLKSDNKEVEGGRCMREGDGEPCFSEKKQRKVWKDCVEKDLE